jgi:hypothetical protein
MSRYSWDEQTHEMQIFSHGPFPKVLMRLKLPDFATAHALGTVIQTVRNEGVETGREEISETVREALKLHAR